MLGNLSMHAIELINLSNAIKPLRVGYCSMLLEKSDVQSPPQCAHHLLLEPALDGLLPNSDEHSHAARITFSTAKQPSRRIHSVVFTFPRFRLDVEIDEAGRSRDAFTRPVRRRMTDSLIGHYRTTICNSVIDTDRKNT